MIRALILAVVLLSVVPFAPAADKPNFIIIFTDDQGYNDLSCFDSKKIKTPNIDTLATEGRRFTSFYVAANAYFNVIEHIDAEVGRLLKTVKDMGLDKKTYIMFTSDNGPWLQFKNHGGSALPLRAGKGTTYEGGHRVPFLIKGPGIPAGTSTAAFTTSMDLFPSIAKLAGLEAKPRGTIDGMDITSALKGSDESPRSEMLFYSSRGALEGLRQGDWKLRMAKGRGRKAKTTVELYNLKKDIGEKQNLASSNPDKIKALTSRMKELDAEITKNVRPRGEFKK